MSQPAFTSKPCSPSLFYRFISLLLFIPWLIHALIHALQYKQWRYPFQRLNINLASSASPSVWLHAASVGEVNLITPLCEQLLQNGEKLTITTSTATGYVQARKHFNKDVKVIVLPIDFIVTSYLFIKLNRFKLAVISETEIWPETLYQAARAQIPVIHINARLSSKTLNIRPFFLKVIKQSLNYFNHHFVRYEQDLKNFESLGIEPSKISVIGNLKFSRSKHCDVKRPQGFTERPYILLASSHDNEEQQITDLLTQHPALPLLVIAPRHPRRAKQILNALKPLNLQIAQRSNNQPINEQTQVYLADTLGELTDFFHCSQLVIMGGSFVNIGGHNVLEPAALGCCIITGPSDDNIQQDIAELKHHQGIKQVASLNELDNTVSALLADEQLRKELGDNAKAFMLGQQDILNQYTQCISRYLESE